MKGTPVWITWESQPRNRSMARALGIPLHELAFSGPRPVRYVRALVATVTLLWRLRPGLVCASNPSLVLTYALLVCRLAFRFRFVTDAHYGGVISVHGSRLVQWLLNFANRRADFVMVTNDAHAARIRSIGGSPLVCPDPLPELPAAPARPAGLNGAGKSVLFICSYDQDEPYGAVFDAARTLAALGFKVFASGSYARVGLSPTDFEHVTLLGYVDRATYDGFLRHVDVVLDLTTWQDCLVCGAYEAMAAEKPCVLSGTPLLTDFFSQGTVFTSHAPDDIAHAVQAAFERRAELRAQIPGWVTDYQRAMRERTVTLRRALGLPVS